MSEVFSASRSISVDSEEDLERGSLSSSSKEGRAKRVIVAEHDGEDPGFLSRASFSWLVSYVIAGYSEPLSFDEMPPLPQRFVVRPLVAKAAKLWDEKAAAYSLALKAWHQKRRQAPRGDEPEEPEPEQPSIVTLFWEMQSSTVIASLALSACQGLLNNAGRPVMLKLLIESVASWLFELEVGRWLRLLTIHPSHPTPFPHLPRAAMPGSTYTLTLTIAFVVLFGLIVLAEGFVLTNTRQLFGAELGTTFLAWAVSLVQRKATRISIAASASAGAESEEDEDDGDGDEDNQGGDDKKKSKKKSKKAEGGLRVSGVSTQAFSSNESAIIGNDLIRGLEDWKWACGLPMNVMGFIAGVITLFALIGFSALIGLSTMAVCLAVNKYLSEISKGIARHDLQAGDERSVFVAHVTSLGLGFEIESGSERGLIQYLCPHSLIARSTHPLDHNPSSSIRLSALKEVSTGIGAIKFMAWEESYIDLLAKKREEECTWLFRYRAVLVGSISIGRASPLLAACATFTYMALAGLPMHPADIFAAIAAYNSLRMPLITIPMNLSQFASLSVTAERISGYLLMEEHKPRAKAGEDAATAGLVIDIKDADFVWGGSSAATNDGTTTNGSANGTSNGNGTHAKASASRFTLRGINLRVPRVRTDNSADDFSAAAASSLPHTTTTTTTGKGTLVAVVGSVGSGKTSLLCSLVGVGMTATRGSAWCVDSLGYVPQAPFVLSGTVLENILMGRELEEERLQRATAAAAFDADLRLMPRGLKTEIGERGVTLSGGQKQRLAISRAVYAVGLLPRGDDPSCFGRPRRPDGRLT